MRNAPRRRPIPALPGASAPSAAASAPSARAVAVQDPVRRAPRRAKPPGRPDHRLARLGLVALALTTASCVAEVGPPEGDVSASQWEAAVAGPWQLPLAVRRAGEAQFVSYDSPPPWDGGRNCGGGLLTGTRMIGEHLLRRFPQIRFYGGYACRQNTANLSQTSVHGTGRALDLMLPLDGGQADNGKGDPIANWLVRNAERIGVQYIVWDRWDWHGGLSGRKDTPYGGPHPHHDHIHMELTVEGARQRTAWFRDRDGDGVTNTRDNCPNDANGGQADRDGDGVGNVCDNCRRDANSGQADRDDDGVGNVCDNCPRVRNAGQADDDGDGRGNRCDNCRGVPNRGQRDTDGDGRGDACDPDDDGDGVPDDEDNCPLVPNAAQGDRDGDGRGNRCDGDDDGDGVADEVDNCRWRPNPDQSDGDGDGEGDACDDRDGDGIEDAADVCPDDADGGQEDLDGDGAGDACDEDRDGDGVADASDLCPDVADVDQRDLDGDGAGDACDADTDGDGILDDVDLCPWEADPEQPDADLDGLGDACDPSPTDADDTDLGPAHEDDVHDAPLDGGTGAAADEPDEPARLEPGCAVGPGAGSITGPAALSFALAVLWRRRRRRR